MTDSAPPPDDPHPPDPSPPANHTPPPPDSAGEDSAVGQPLSVLLVEDNSVARKLVARLLEKRGHTVTAMTNGAEAVEAIRDHNRWDVVLMDLEMPEMDGPTAAAAIRMLEADHGDNRTPIIALTAAEDSADLTRCRDAGMDAVASKPIRVGELMRVIAGVLRQVDEGR